MLSSAGKFLCPKRSALQAHRFGGSFLCVNLTFTVMGGAVISPWRLALVEVFILHNFQKIYKFMGYYYAHFLFDTFRDFSCKGVFLCFILKSYRFYPTFISDKSVEKSVGCRSPPSTFRF